MIETERLTLRGWRAEDVASFHAMAQDEEVMRHIGPSETRRESRRAWRRMAAAQARYGHCFWVVERRADQAFVGLCGLLPLKPPVAGEVEIGWRLGRAHWGRGYAREAASACLEWAWEHLDVPTIAAVTVPGNTRSRLLMERLGMTRVVGGDFDHPELEVGDPLRRHLLYRIARPARG